MFSERPWPNQNEVLEYFSLTIPDMIYNREAITFSSTVRKMSVSRSYLYRHSETRSAIEYYRPSGMSKAELQKEVARLCHRVLLLELRCGDTDCTRPLFPQSDAECIQVDLGESHANNK